MALVLCTSPYREQPSLNLKGTDKQTLSGHVLRRPLVIQCTVTHSLCKKLRPLTVLVTVTREHKANGLQLLREAQIGHYQPLQALRTLKVNLSWCPSLAIHYPHFFYFSINFQATFHHGREGQFLSREISIQI